jgi:uncharacterized protein (TIGR00269 family)
LQSAAVRCSICGRPAIVTLRYARLSLCPQHFLEYIAKRVERTVKRYRLLKPGEKVVLGVSAGKDSSTLAHILSRMLEPGQLLLVHINLGIPSYSDAQEERVRKLAETIGAKLLVLHVEELTGAKSIYELARKARRPVCSVCGTVKRYVLNAVGVELGAAVATGHTLDDAVAYLLKNFITYQLEHIRKWTPRTPPQPGAAPRIRPLIEVSEKETLLYALLQKLPILHKPCPYRPHHPIEDTLKEAMNKLEEQHPGIKLSFLRQHVKNTMKNAGKEEEKPRTCRACGLISQGELCSFCKITMKAAGEPMGPRAREVIRAKLRTLGLK